MLLFLVLQLSVAQSVGDVEATGESAGFTASSSSARLVGPTVVSVAPMFAVAGIAVGVGGVVGGLMTIGFVTGDFYHPTQVALAWLAVGFVVGLVVVVCLAVATAIAIGNAVRQSQWKEEAGRSADAKVIAIVNAVRRKEHEVLVAEQQKRDASAAEDARAQRARLLTSPAFTSYR